MEVRRLFTNPVNGTGSVQVNNGTLTLAGANTYTGDTILNGGQLIANRAENPGVSGPLGVGGTIYFNGGTLGFSRERRRRLLGPHQHQRQPSV